MWFRIEGHGKSCWVELMWDNVNLDHTSKSLPISVEPNGKSSLIPDIVA